MVGERTSNGFQHQLLVYAASEQAALSVAATEVEIDSAWTASRVAEYDHRCRGTLTAYVEDDPEFLRDEGWRYEYEDSCDGCGLYPVGLDQYAVCRESSRCRACGCSSDCTHSEGWNP